MPKNINARIAAEASWAYDVGRESSWQQLLGTDPQLVATEPSGLLESATPDTYLAIDADTATTTGL